MRNIITKLNVVVPRRAPGMAEAIQIRAVRRGLLGPLFNFQSHNRDPRSQKKALTAAHPEQANE